MADENDSSSGKKRRIIHWNPEAGRETAQRRWTWKRVLGWTVGGFFGLLFTAAILIRVAKLVLGPEIFQSGGSAVASAPSHDDANTAFVSQSKAELAHTQTTKALNEIRRLQTDHPVQLQRLILITKAHQEGEALLASHDWARAFAAFEATNADIDTFSRNVKAKHEAQQGYDAILVRIKDLERARNLAPGTLEAAFEDAGAGRKLLDDGNFLGAKKVFDEGFAELKKAEDKLTQIAGENLLKGQQALTKGQRDAAKRAFNAALELIPGNDIALAGLKRAENIDRVYALLLQGEALEKNAQYGEAAESYAKAFALDNVSAVAQAGQARASRLEKETKFEAAYTAALAAVKRRDWTKAITESQNALRVYPQKTEVQAMLRSARENEHRDAVQKALNKGYGYENAHQWKEARDAYAETLKLEPEQADAKEAYIRCGTMIRTLLEYDRLIESAKQLANSSEFQPAIRTFSRAMAIKPNYPLANDDTMQQLHTLLNAQSKPVDVTFKSDGKTYVSIANFRQPTLSENFTVKVLPGDYQVIGRRKGYKDVLMLLQVRNGTPPPTVTVICQTTADRS
ncbi:MAG: Tetratricopeptide repeat protein [Lacunisphaera sp.]|nr:Tetratricopeptide repeat protein [Lacunisphaera sp.]